MRITKISIPRSLTLVAALTAAGLLSRCGPVLGVINDPHRLPGLAQDARVRYGADAESYAAHVAKLLPAAIAKVEAAQGRPFGQPFIVAAFMDDDAYASANGSGSRTPRGVTFLDRVSMSPRLWREETGYLEADLAHELSHEHLMSHLSAWQYYVLPIWFVEGLAVMVSDGGGAQLVSAEDARAEIVAGRFIETPDEKWPLGNFSLEPPPGRAEYEGPRKRMHLAYRQAGMLVAHLRAENPKAFASLLDRLLSGERFKSALESSYGESLEGLRQRFLTSLGDEPSSRR